MRRKLKIIVTTAFIAFAVSIFSIQTNAGFRAASMKDRQTNTTRVLYLRNCARCHGADGLGQTEAGRKLEVPNLTEEAKGISSAKVTRVITNGKSDMPAFGKKLTKKQISNLAAYVRKL